MVIRSILRALRWLPVAIEREHLRWAIREIDPMHPDVPMIVRRINELERAS